jgi:predicted O-methyltransferase YrrM
MESLLPPRDEVLAEMESYAAQHKVPIIGPVVGRIFYQLIRITKAKRVFEMGSAIGYSTVLASRAVGDGGKVYYTDGDPANAARADAYLRRADVQDRVEILTGNALDLLEQTPGEFDVIFCDIDKEQYPQAFHKAVPRIRRGGLLLADNVLWSGRVTRPPQDEATRGIIEFNRLIYSSKELFPTILPVRDGFAICEKL